MTSGLKTVPQWQYTIGCFAPIDAADLKRRLVKVVYASENMSTSTSSYCTAIAYNQAVQKVTPQVAEYTAGDKNQFPTSTEQTYQSQTSVSTYPSDNRLCFR